MSPLGRVIVLILVIGLAVGGWRWWQGTHGGAPGGAGSPGVFGFGGASSGGPGDIEVLTTATKQAWLQQEIDKFNRQHQGTYHLTLKLIESRDSLHAILDGKERPVIWSPSSPVWIQRLVDVWAQQHGGEHIAAFDDAADYRVFFKSPLVFLTTRQKAAFLRPILSGPRPWAAVRELSLGQKKTPWGTFRFSHADPLNANSGMLTMSLILTEYAQEHGQTGDLVKTAASPAFATYLQQLDRALDLDSTEGSSRLEKAYTGDPNSRDFITAYENKALEAAAQNPDLVAIYPNPTVNADQSAAILSASWVSSEQKDGAQAFLTFLAGPESIRDGLQSYFRPAQPSGDISLAATLTQAAGQGFQQTYSTIELPPYDALNDAASQWRVYVAHQRAQ